MWMKKECAVERAQRFCAGRQKRIRHGLTAGRETDTLTHQIAYLCATSAKPLDGGTSKGFFHSALIESTRLLF